MGKGGSLSESVVKKIMLSYAYVGVWIFLSFTMIVYNKYILDKKMYNWPFPISLTMIHMSFCSTFAFLLVRVFKLVEPVSMSRDLYLSSVVPNLPHQHMGAGVEARDSGTRARHGRDIRAGEIRLTVNQVGVTV